MGCGKPLSEYEKGQINAYKDQGLSINEIAKKLSRSRCVIQNFVKNSEEYGILKSPGRPKFFSKRGERELIRIALKSKLNAKEISEKLAHSPSYETVKRVLKKSGFFKYSSMKSYPKLKKIRKTD